MLVCTKFTMSGRMGTVNTAGRVVGSWATPSVEKTDTTGRADMAGVGGGVEKGCTFCSIPGKMGSRAPQATEPRNILWEFQAAFVMQETGDVAF